MIIGHRGTGKTSWIKTVQNHFEENHLPILTFDVDQQIEKKTQKTIFHLFEKGESSFRKVEKKVFQQCLQKSKNFNGIVLISLGAGYSDDIPHFCTVIHLKRTSDSDGRIFFNRPRLLSNKDSLSEYQELYKKRELLYQSQRDLVWTRLDGFQGFGVEDQVFFGEKSLPFTNGVLTLQEKQFPNEEKLENFLNHKIQMGFRFFELKNSEISISSIEKVLKKIPIQNLLFSFREKKDSHFKSYLEKMVNSSSQEMTIDWPLEWGLENTFFKKISQPIYSLHTREKDETLESLFNKFPKEKNIHCKLAVEIFSFEELWKGYLWQKEGNRSFHPRSADGRWKWYRLLFGTQQLIYFLREDTHQGVLDQPVIAEACRFVTHSSPKGFACVLGNPIEHSITPSEQFLFFKDKQLLTLKILMKEKEANSLNLKILENLGMKFAAITSPLKKSFYQLFKEFNSQERDTNPQVTTHSFSNLKLCLSDLDWKSLNTIILIKGKWKGFNTDVYGALFLRMWIENISKHKKKSLSVAVWGGGGVLNVLEKTFTEEKLLKYLDKDFDFQKNSFKFSFYSARSGQIRKGSKEAPDILVWAVGRNRMSHCVYPPSDWKPSYILDLNYIEDSPAREYAIRTQSEYISGHMWFKIQAEWQRSLFKYFNCP